MTRWNSYRKEIHGGHVNISDSSYFCYVFINLYLPYLYSNPVTLGGSYSTRFKKKPAETTVHEVHGYKTTRFHRSSRIQRTTFWHSTGRMFVRDSIREASQGSGSTEIYFWQAWRARSISLLNRFNGWATEGARLELFSKSKNKKNPPRCLTMFPPRLPGNSHGSLVEFIKEGNHASIPERALDKC